VSGIQALLGTALVAALAHALLPDHWLPYVLSAKARGMSTKQTIAMTAAGAVAHLVSTVIVGLLFTLAGSAVAANISAGLERIVGFVVIGLGVYFLFKGWSRYHGHHHSHMDEGDGHRHSHSPRKSRLHVWIRRTPRSSALRRSNSDFPCRKHARGVFVPCSNWHLGACYSVRHGGNCLAFIAGP